MKAAAAEVESTDLTIQQVADYLGYDRTTVSHWIREGRLNAKRVPGSGRNGAKRITRAELQRFLADALRTPTTRPEDTR